MSRGKTVACSISPGRACRNSSDALWQEGGSVLASGRHGVLCQHVANAALELERVLLAGQQPEGLQGASPWEKWVGLQISRRGTATEEKPGGCPTCSVLQGGLQSPLCVLAPHTGLAKWEETCRGSPGQTRCPSSRDPRSLQGLRGALLPEFRTICLPCIFFPGGTVWRACMIAKGKPPWRPCLLFIDAFTALPCS